MKRVLKVTPNSAGGINTGVHPAQLDDNEFAELLNFFVLGDSIRPRVGTSRLTSAALNEVLSAGVYKSDTGRFKLICAGDDVSVFTPGTSLSAHSVLSCRYGDVYSPTAGKRPFIFQGREVFYMIDPAGGPLRRGTDSYYETAGIEPPNSAVTIAQGAAGVMTAADYKVTVIFRNSLTNDQSDFSPVSNTLTLAASKQIDVTNIPVSNTPQCDVVDVYITPPDQTNLYLLAATVTNGTTSVSINLTPLDLQTLMPITNGVPPENVVAGAIFDNSLFLTDGKTLYKSNYLQYETFDLDNNVQPVFNDDGHDCNVLYPWGTSRLIAGKPNYVVYFTATGTGDYVPTVLSDKYGVRSPHAMKSIENILIWFDGERFQRSDNGATPKDISTLRIKEYLDNIAATDKDNLVAEIAPRLDSYLVTVPQTDSSPVVLAYNYKVNAWSVLAFATKPVFIIEGYDINEDRQLYAITDDFHVDLLFDENSHTDSTEPIEYTIKTRAFKADELDIRKTYSRTLGILCTNTPVEFTLDVYEDSAENPTITVPAYLWKDREDWKVFECSTLSLSSGASYVQFKLTLENSDEIDLRNFKIVKFAVDMIKGHDIKRQYEGVGL